MKKVALVIQVLGFFPAFVALFFLPESSKVFVIAFSVHLVGDVLFFLADTNGGKDA